MNIEEKEKILELLKDRPDLICDLLWRRSDNEVQKILELPEWKEEKFQGLLTSNIWQSNVEEVKQILEIPEWEEEKFQGLLTSNIWKSNAETVKEKLHLEYWKDEKYAHLLAPSIFCISTNNIKNGIELFEKYKISEFITNRSLRRNPKELEILINYLQKNNIDLVVENKDGKEKLNPILNASTKQLKEKYNIDMKKMKKEMKGVER